MTVMDPGESYYDILNVSVDADSEEIASSYRKIAKVLHPDVCESPDAEELFKAVNEAYEVLRDPDKRAEYDSRLFNPLINGKYKKTGHYRHPRTWYSSHTYGGFTYAGSPEFDNRKMPDMKAGAKETKDTLPRILQILIFYLTLLMAILIFTQLFLLPAISNIEADKARNSFNAGISYMNENEYLLAIKKFEEAVEKNPEFSLAWLQMGIANMKKGDELKVLLKETEADNYYRAAITALSKVSPEDSQTEEALVAKATVYYNLDQTQRAETLIKELYNRYPNSTKVDELLHMISHNF